MPMQIQQQPTAIVQVVATVASNRNGGLGLTAQSIAESSVSTTLASGAAKPLPKQDTFTATVPATPATAISPAVLAQLVQQHQTLQPAQARPAFALTTSLPEARLIKNPAAKALNTILASVGVGAVVGGVSGLLTPMFMNKKTGLWLAFGGTLGATVGAGIGLLLGYGVFGRVAEQQQETENKVHLAKTRVLVEQVTPLSLDTVPME